MTRMLSGCDVIRSTRFLKKTEWKCRRPLTYKHVGGAVPFVYKTIGKILDEAAEKYGNRTALVSVYQNRRITFKEVNEKAEVIAAGVLNSGISPGDRVGLWSPNSVEWYVSSLALAKAGVISVYLNPSYQASELKHCLQAVGVKMLLAAESFKTLKYDKVLEEMDPVIPKSEPENLKSKVLPQLKTIVSISEKNYPGLVSFSTIESRGTPEARQKLKEYEKDFRADDASNIQFTSGTTGSPKGAVLSHFNVINNSLSMSKRQEFHLREHIMCFMGPFFHALGSVIAMLTCLHTGITLVVPDMAFSASKAAEAIVKENCTILVGTPTMYIDIMRVMGEKGLKPNTIEVAVTGGAFASTALFNDMKKNLNLKRVASVYGLTETGPICFMSKPSDTVEKQTTTVGYLMEHVEAKVVDDKGFMVPWNAPGELWVRGYNVMKGYWENEQKTKEAITPDRWFKTGDQFVLNEDGYGRVVGRIKDVIIRGGENIYPEDVEELLSTHPDILEVQVIGVPDRRLGEQICACIRIKQNAKISENDVKEFCKGKIADFKIPAYVWFVDKFPKTSSGKVQKYILRALAVNHFKIVVDGA